MPPKNNLPTWGNESSMNLNSLILTNIQSSPYFKNELIKLKTYHEVIDEIYYKVDHLEPWERGSRQTSGQIGMCGGVRGVGAGGIVSSAYCLLFKLYTLKLTRKQVMGVLNHADSPYIRSLGFMYIRYTQPPQDLYDWFEPFFEDEEEVDPKAGGGTPTTIGQMVQSMLLKQDWFSTLFPRIPVPVAKDIERRFADYKRQAKSKPETEEAAKEGSRAGSRKASPEVEAEDNGERSTSNSKEDKRESSRGHEKRSRSRDRRSKSREKRNRSRDREREREREKGSEKRRDRRSRSKDRRPRSRERRASRSPVRRRDERDDERRKRYSPSRDRRKRSPERERKRSREQRRSRSRDRRRSPGRRGDQVDYADELRREQERQKRESRRASRSRSRSRDRSRDRSRRRSHSR